MHSKSANRFARAAGVVVLLAVIAPLRSPAPLYQDGYSDADAKALAANYSASLGRLSLYDSVGPFDVSGVFLNSHWFLTSAHALINPFGAGDASISGITQGSTSGGPMILASNVFIHPAFDHSGNHPDCALIYIPSGVVAPTLEIVSASTSEVGISAGFGFYGSVTGGLFPQDSNARGWRAVVAPGALGGFSTTYYQSTFFVPDGLILNGRGLSGDSGCPVFNDSGQLVGIVIAASTGLSAYGHTEFLRLTQPEVFDWIQSIITPVEPQILSLTREGADMRLTWQGKGGSNYVVQAGSALGGTNTFTDLTSVIALPGVGSVVTNFLDAGALTNAATRFYRIRTD